MIFNYDRVYLCVRYEQKNEAKGMGCKWDKIEKAWYAYKDDKNCDELIEKFNIKEPNAKLIEYREYQNKKSKKINKIISKIEKIEETKLLQIRVLHNVIPEEWEEYKSFICFQKDLTEKKEEMKKLYKRIKKITKKLIKLYKFMEANLKYCDCIDHPYHQDDRELSHYKEKVYSLNIITEYMNKHL